MGGKAYSQAPPAIHKGCTTMFINEKLMNVYALNFPTAAILVSTNKSLVVKHETGKLTVLTDKTSYIERLER